MTDVFSVILKLGMAGSYAILIVLIVRFFLRKNPKIFSYILWAIVFFRLICPYSFTASFSIVPESITYPERIELTPPTFETIDNPVIPSETIKNPDYLINTSENITVTTSCQRTWMDTVSAIWILGCITLWGYSITSLTTLKRKLKSAKQINEDVYESEGITTPFVLGITHPRIYLPVHLQNDELEYILMHERTHIQRKDYIIKPLAFMIVCLHWFNPLVWVAWFCMSKDMEMSCDEAVIQKMGTSIKKDYSLSLLNMASQKTILNTSPLAFSDHNAKNRILNILNYKKPAFWMISLITILLTFLSLGLSFNKYKSPELESTLNTLSPYLYVKPDSIEVLSKTKDNETVIYKLSQGNSSNPKNIFFLIFKDGNLSDAYFNLPDEEKIERKFYTLSTAIELAKQYAHDIYQTDVEVSQNISYRTVNNYGDSPIPYDYGMFIEFTCTSESQTIYITVSVETGKIISSTTSDYKGTPYRHYSGVDHSLTFYRGWTIHSIHNIMSDIYISEMSDEYICFDQQIIQNPDQSFTCTYDNKEIKMYKYDHNTYDTDMNSISGFAKMDFISYFRSIYLDYSRTHDKTKTLEKIKKLFSTRAIILHEKQELHWIDSFHQILTWIDEQLETHESISFSKGSMERGNGQVLTTTSVTAPENSTYSKLCTWTEHINIVAEHQTVDNMEYVSYKIDDYHLFPPEEHWNTTTFTSPQEAAEYFYQAIDQRDYSKIFTMMPYRDIFDSQGLNLMQQEVKPTQIESIETYKNTALAIIAFDETIYSTDSMGTTSTYVNKRQYYLKLIQTDEGWIMNDFTTRRTYKDWIDKEQK